MVGSARHLYTQSSTRVRGKVKATTAPRTRFHGAFIPHDRVGGVSTPRRIPMRYPDQAGT